MLRYFRKSLVAVCLIAAAAVVMLTPAPAAAQALYGSLTGTVTDQQKAAMPGVTVTAINTGTTQSTEAVTDEISKALSTARTDSLKLWLPFIWENYLKINDDGWL